jgi:hypothetical protein
VNRQICVSIARIVMLDQRSRCLDLGHDVNGE